MRSPSFQARFAAVLAVVALLDGTRAWSGPRARKGLMSGPPGGMFLGGSGIAPSPTGTGPTGSNPNTVPPTGGIGIHAISPRVGNLPSVGVPAGSFYIFSVTELASALATINLPLRMSLSDVCVECDDGPGSFEIGYATSNNAHFVGPASATDATGLIGVGSYAFHIPVNWTPSVAMPAATFTANGDCFQATLSFCTQSNPNNPDISAYRAMYFTETFTDTTADAQSVTFDNGPAVPVAFFVLEHALATATSLPMGTIDYSNGSQFKHIIPMQGNQAPLQLVPAQPIAPALTFAFNQTFSTLGAATNVIAAVAIFY